MSVAALPPPPFQSMSRIMSKPQQQPHSLPRPSLQSRPSSSSSTLSARPAPASSSSIQVKPSSSKDTSSSAGKVFARPSKEWVLPERAKPGRKVSVEEPDNKRQSQNRLSQRAHRARRTDYIQTLEERLRQYEADEIHSNVRLQEVARALKADNERLKKELLTLRSEVDDLKSDKDSWDIERRSYVDLVGSLNAELSTLRGGNYKELSTPPHILRRPSDRSTRISPPVAQTLASSAQRQTIACPICPDPDPDCPCQQTASHPSLSPARPTAPLAALHLAVKAMAEHDPTPTPGGSTTCGLCQSKEECLCSVIDDVEDVKPVILPTPSPELDLGVAGDGDRCGLCTSASFCACKATSGSGSSASPISITTSTLTATTYPTPPSSVALPLRLGRDRPSRSTPLWVLDQPTLTPRAEAVCSGDPSNCAACRDDRFGQEFCANIFERDPTPGAQDDAARPAPPADTQDTMTPDQAWKTLKAHPNSRFASLSLLADVVAGRTNHSNERSQLSPYPDGSQPASPAMYRTAHPAGAPSPGGALNTTSRKRNLAVESRAVQSALRLLDSTPAPASPAPSHDDDRDAKRRRVEVR